MAEMIPSKASAGEKRLFEVVERLPSDCVVYYEPRVNLLNPDFIVIVPNPGVCVDLIVLGADRSGKVESLIARATFLFP